MTLSMASMTKSTTTVGGWPPQTRPESHCVECTLLVGPGVPPQARPYETQDDWTRTLNAMSQCDTYA